jgi:cytidylate kinase
MESEPPIIITVDGPSASGKSSVSRLIADALGYHHVDTGSMYRAFTWKVLEEKIDPKDTKAILDLMRRIRYDCDFVEVANGPVQLRNRLDGVDPGAAIREPRIEQYASVVAAIPEVREWMVQKQRDLAKQGDLVMEGRDIGTVVFPNAPYKFYFEADASIRAKRRAKDQQALGAKPEVTEVSQAIAERDHRDQTRKVAPLKVADDAIRIDTTPYTPQETADVVLKHIRSKHASKK